MATSDWSRHKSEAGQSEMQGNSEADREFEASNNINNANIGNAVQANQISGGVHFYGVVPPNAYTPHERIEEGSGNDGETSRDDDAQNNSVVGDYLSRIFEERSPIVLWSLFMLTTDAVIVGLVEYFAGARLPGEPPSEDLDTAEAGAFFAAICAAILLWRHVARRNGSGKWRSLDEVHPRIVDVLHRRYAAIPAVITLVGSASLFVPRLMDPSALTTYTSAAPGDANTSGLSDFGITLCLVLILVEVAIFCIHVTLRCDDEGDLDVK